MVSLLLIISFLLHIILIVVIYQLYQRINNINEEHRKIEALLEDFLNEIKKENERLQIRLDERPTVEHEVEQAYLFQKEAHKGHKHTELLEKEENKEENFYHLEKQEEQVETSTEGKILHLHQEGWSASAIAQKLNRGKTEVELILKFHKNE